MIHICDYGCGQEAKFQFKNGKWCCSKSCKSCPAQRERFRGENKSKGFFGKHHSKETRKRQSEANSGENHPRGMLGKHHSEETRKRQSEANSGENHPNFGKNFSEEHKKKLSESHTGKRRITYERIKEFAENEGFEFLMTENEYKENYKDQYSELWFRCSKGFKFPTNWSNFRDGTIRCPECVKERQRQSGIVPNYNPEGCRMIDKYGNENNYNFQHAENGGEYHIKELGYWVDGYDKERNTVIEIDEYHHFDRDGNISEKDVQRQKEITDFLGCKFVRLRI